MGLAAIVLVIAAHGAEAHLMPPGKGTLNVVGSKAYIVLSVPVASFYGAGNVHPHLSQEDLERDQSKLRERVRQGLQVRSGENLATYDQVLFNLPSGQGHDEAHGDDLVVMIVARFPEPPPWIELTSDFWTDDDDELVIQATVSEGAETIFTEIGTLTQSRPSHLFFREAGST